MLDCVLKSKMFDRIIFFLLVTLVFEANSQLCGCGGPAPFYPGPIVPQLAPALPCMGPTLGPQPIIAEPCIGAPPLIPQLMPAPPPILAAPQPIFAAPPLIAQPYPNVVAATVVDNTVSNSLANAIQLLIVSNLIENTLNGGVGPSSIVNLCDTIINPLPCEYKEIIPVTQSIMPSCIYETPIFETVGPMCGCEMPMYPNYVIPEMPIQPMFASAVPTMGPVAAEVLFPSAIPAQLTCNFGYMNTNVPCVSVNVEPLQSFDSCNPFYNNGYFY